MLKITTVLLVFSFNGPHPEIKRTDAVFTSRDECKLVAAVVKKELDFFKRGSKVVCVPRAADMPRPGSRS